MFLIGSLLAETLVIVGQDDGRRTGHAGCHRTHSGSKNGGNEQSRHSHRQFLNNKEGEHVIRLCLDVRRKQIGVYLIISIERRTNQEEDGRNGDEQVTSEECRELGFTLTLGCMVALHVVLVDTVVLQVDKDAVNQTHPECGGTDVQREVAQIELVVLCSNLKGLHRTFRHLEQEDSQTHQSTTNQNETLDGFRPYHPFHASHHRVDDNGNAGHYDDQLNVPPHQAVHWQCQQEQNGSHTGNLSQKVTHRGIEPRPHSETLFQEAVG